MNDMHPIGRGGPKPLGLPVGSVRALLLLGLAARAILDLRAEREVAHWLLAAILVSAVAYFGARASGGSSAGHRPLGLPPGTVRFLFLAALGYGAWLYLQGHPVEWQRAPVVWVLAGFVVGVLVRLVLLKAAVADDDVGTNMIYHLQSLLTLAAVAALVVLGVKTDVSTPDWVPPLLAAAATYYAGVR